MKYEETMSHVNCPVMAIFTSAMRSCRYLERLGSIEELPNKYWTLLEG
jgi:hypothetical protein